MTRSRRKRRRTTAADALPIASRHDEPAGEGWVEWGGERILEVDTTAGGAPIGLTVGEFRRANERWEPGAGWAVAKRVLRQLLRSLGVAGADDAVGFVRFLGEGLSYRAYRAECELPKTGGGLVDLVVRLPRADCPEDLATLAQRELELLNYLSTLNLPIRLPRVVGAIPVAGGLALVQEMVSGIPLDLRASRCPGGRPWEVVAQAASVCHGVNAHLIPSIVPRQATRRAHALAVLARLEAIAIPEAKDAHAWGMEHLPPDEPGSLLHGDLLGQNLLLSFDKPLGVIDWAEAQIGDPAYDLAIVTRGARQPFQVAGGLERLLDAYNTQVQLPVTATDVHLYELCLVAGFLQADAREYGAGSPRAENSRAQLRNLLRRVDQVP